MHAWALSATEGTPGCQRLQALQRIETPLDIPKLVLQASAVHRDILLLFILLDELRHFGRQR